MIGKKSLYISAACLVALIIICTTGPALADVPANNALDVMFNQFQAAAQGWETQLRIYATRLFWILAGIDIALMAINMAIRPDEFSGFVANLVRKVLIIGFFFALIEPNSPIYGPYLAKATLNSFRGAVSAINNTPTSAADIFNSGFNLMVKIFDQMSLRHPIDSLAYTIAGYIIMAVFGMISAMVLLISVQMYIVIYAGILLLGFGGSSFTQDIAITYLRAFFSTGVKLFLMYLIANIGMYIVNGWITTFTDINFKQMGLFIGVSIVLLVLVKTIPDMLSGLINGTSYGSGNELVHMGKQVGKIAAGAAVGATAGAAGGFMAVKEAAALADTQGAKGVIGKTAAVGKNLASGSTDYAKGRLSGGIHKHGGTTGGKIAAQIAKKHGLTAQNTSTQNKDSNGAGSVSRDNK